MVNAQNVRFLLAGLFGVISGALAYQIAGVFTGIAVGATLPAMELIAWRRRRFRPADRTREAALHEYYRTHVPYFRKLNAPSQQTFIERATRFLDEQRFYYVEKGLDEPQLLSRIDPTLAWKIAAAASILSAGFPEFEWPNIRDILVYPEAFDDDYQPQADAHILGMVHAQGPIIFSAQELRNAFEFENGQNVAIHELAHVLDFQDGFADGVIGKAADTKNESWHDFVDERILDIRRRRYRHLGSYAGTNAAEFLAVAIEMFIERPSVLRHRDRELYDRLVVTLRQDPENLTNNVNVATEVN